MTSRQTDSTETTDYPVALPRTDRTRNENHTATYRRRGFLRGAGAVTVAGLLAGCTDDGDGGNTEPVGGGDSRSVDDWLSDTGNYDAVVDATGERTVTVEVGARGNSGSNAFAPAAVEISPGTTVNWTWVSGYHNVVAAGGQFDSGGPERDATFEHAFETAGTVRYYCEPHESVGMKGAVVVTRGADDESSRPSAVASGRSDRRNEVTE